MKYKLYVLFVVLLTSVCFADSKQFNYFQGFRDDGMSELGSAQNGFQQNMLKTVDYTMNYNTPGFIRKSIHNIRTYDKDAGVHRIVLSSVRRWIEGVLIETDRELDFSVVGDNKTFFIARLPLGTQTFTRDGRFMIDEQGRLVTLAGQFPVEGENGEIIIPRYESLSVSRSGVLFADGVPIDRLKIAVFNSFDDMRLLYSFNGVYFILTRPVDLLEGPEHYAVRQGFYMNSNTYKSNDSKSYINSYSFAHNGIQTMLDSMREFNAAVGAQ